MNILDMGADLYDKAFQAIMLGVMKRSTDVGKSLSQKIAQAAKELGTSISQSNQTASEAQAEISDAMRLNHVTDDDDQPATRGDIRAVATAAKRMKT